MQDVRKSRRFQFEPLEPRHLLASGPRITEFMARNDSTLADEDGDFSDWIEIRNDSSSSVNLNAWYLTDDKSDLTKWQFDADPLLASGGYLVVFASGKDRPSGNELHASFRLDADGEYLALVEPNGNTIASEIDLTSIEHRSDVSYGETTELSQTTTLVSKSSPADVLVPNGPQDPSWTTAEFVAGADWSSARAGVGFQIGEPEARTAKTLFIVNTDASGKAGLGNQSIVDRLTNDFEHSVTVVDDDVVSTDDGNGKDLVVISSTVSPSKVGTKFRDTSLPIVHWESALNDDFELSDSGRLSLFQTEIDILPSAEGHPLAAGLGAGRHAVRTSSSILHTANEANVAPGMTWIANATNGAPAIGVIEAGGILNSGNPAADLRITSYFGDEALNGATESGRALFDASIDYALEGRLAGPDFAEHFAADVRSAMAGNKSSIQIRVPFDMTGLADPAALLLRMKYNDGFVAFVNGVEVARRNAPEAVDWNSAATQSRPIDAAVEYEEIDISDQLDSLNLSASGENILAIQGLNTSANDADFLIVPELIAAAEKTLRPRFFPSPTPGTENNAGVAGFVKDTRFSVDRGFYDAPFHVQISSQTAGAEIRYTTDGTPPNETHGVIYTAPILVDTTTNLRAVAYKEDYLATNVDTQTYVFLDDVIRQPAEIPGYPFGGSKWAGSDAYVPQDSEMDPEIVNDPAYADALFDGLLSIPSMSITTDLEGAFTESGWYTGENIEQPVSVEILYPEQPNQNHQADAGIESHSHDRLKRSLRLNFRSEYGDASFDTNLFRTAPLHSDTAVDRVDRIILRGGNNRSWARIWNPDKTAYTIDQFYRDSQIAMSGYGMRGNFVHLYLNGVYWGLYNPVERADSFYTSRYFGGDEEDWFAVNHGGALRGDSQRWTHLRNTLVNRDMSVDVNYAELHEYLDVEGFIDYLVISWWTAVSDWPQNNWYGGNRNESSPFGPEPFRYFAWDGEWSWGQGGQSNPTGRAHVHSDFRAGRSGGDTITRLWHAARANDDFMMLFADRVYGHLFHDGALTETNAKQRWTTLTEYVRDAVVAESARWGDAMQTEGHPTRTRDVDWQREVNRILNLMTGNNDIFVNALRNEDYYPAFHPPTLNQRGGLVPAGFEVTLDNPTAMGTVYYTLDGTDPRLPGGAVSTSALIYDAPIHVQENAVIKTRAFANEWSALNEAGFVVEPLTSEQLAITEISFNPSAPTPQELELLPGLNNDDFEFLEFKNIHSAPIDLTGLRFDDGIEFTFSNVQLASQEYGVVVQDAAAFALRYGSEVNVIGEYQGNLNNGGERLLLVDSLGSAIHDFEYQDDRPWPERADGVGGSLELIDHDTTRGAEYGKHYRWRGSTEFGGSPGAPGQEIIGVMINEVFAGGADASEADSIELFNSSSGSVNIGGWYLSNSDNDLLRFQIPAGTLIEPFGFAVFDENQFNPTPDEPGPGDFSIDTQRGDDIWLTIGDDAGRARSFVDEVRFGTIKNGDSWGRSSLTDGSTRMARQSRVTLGCTNSQSRSGPLIISEVQYNPGEPLAVALEIDENLVEDDLEFVEVHNPSASTVSLADWRIRGGIDFEFGISMEIAAGQSIVVARFDPERASNATRLAAFRAHYAIGADVIIIGGYGGQLSDSGERITLLRPGAPTDTGPAVTARHTEDEFFYDDRGAWPDADGTGQSLQRFGAVLFADQALAWRAGSPSPGTVDFSGHASGDLTGDLTIDANDIDIFLDEVRRSTSVTHYDLNTDGTVDTDDVAWLIENTLGTLPGDANLDGTVDAEDFNIWQSNRFQTCQGWTTADFNGDGVTDGSDFNIWNTYRFQAVFFAALPKHADGVNRHPRAALQPPSANSVASEPSWASQHETSMSASNRSDANREIAGSKSRTLPLARPERMKNARLSRRQLSVEEDRLAFVDEWFAALGWFGQQLSHDLLPAWKPEA